MASLTKATVSQAVFENVYDRLKASVTSVTLSDSSTSTIQTYTGAFPDQDIDDKSKYPILVVNSPDLSWEDFTLTKKQVNGTFSIDIFTTKAEASDVFMDAIISSIEGYRKNFRDLGMVYINLEDTSYDHFQRDKIKVHMKSCTFSFKYRFQKTQSY